MCVLSFMKLTHKSSFVAHCESAGWPYKGVGVALATQYNQDDNQPVFQVYLN